MLGPIAFLVIVGKSPEVAIDIDFTYLIIGGALVGFGASLGSGCTSGHGVCGLARLSPRSIIATATFLTTAVITVFLNQ